MKQGHDYDELRPTISISFLNDILFPDVADHHLRFRLGSEAHPALIFSKVQVIHVIELPKFRKSAAELATPAAHDKGLAEGLAKGRSLGLKLGIITRIHLCQRLLKITMTPEEELLPLSHEDLVESQ